MKTRKSLGKLTAGIAVAGMMLFSSIPAFAAESPEKPELPESMIMDGRVFTMDKTAGGGPDTATLENSERMTLSSSYRLLGSDVRMYVDYSHGHGGDHYSAGWVQTTAPKFTARAEIWSGGRTVVAGTNNPNRGNIASAASGLAVGYVSNAVPRIFYAW